MDKPAMPSNAKTAKALLELLNNFLEIESEVRKKGVELLILKYKQCVILKRAYDLYGTEAIKTFAAKTGYNERYLYDYLRIATVFENEEEFLKAIEKYKLDTLRKVIEYTEIKLRIPEIVKVTQKVEKDLNFIEKKISEIEDVVEKHFAPDLSNEVKIVKNEFEEFRNYLKTIYEKYLVKVLYEIKKLENPTPKEKIYYFDLIKKILTNLESM